MRNYSFDKNLATEKMELTDGLITIGILAIFVAWYFRIPKNDGKSDTNN